jgi:ribosomal protein L37AE/L43A
MTVCAVCPRTAPDGQHLCQLDAAELRAWLAELPHQARLLSEFLAPSTQPAQGRTGGTGRAHAPLPVDIRVLALLGPGRLGLTPDPDDDGITPIRAVLDAWAGHIAYHHPSAARARDGTAYIRPCEQAHPRHGTTISGWCQWLTAYLPYATALPSAGDFHRQIGDLVRRIRDLTHVEPRDHPRAAPCPVCDTCTLVRTDGRWHIHCRDCGHQMTPDDYDQHAARYLAARQADTAA